MFNHEYGIFFEKVYTLKRSTQYRALSTWCTAEREAAGPRTSPA